MELHAIAGNVAVAPQISIEDIATLAANGVRTVICNRPDEEVVPALLASRMAQAATAVGIQFHYLPIQPGGLSTALAERFGQLVDGADGPVLAYCRSGTRSAGAWALSQKGRMPAREILGCAAAAGYDLSGLAHLLE